MGGQRPRIQPLRVVRSTPLRWRWTQVVARHVTAELLKRRSARGDIVADKTLRHRQDGNDEDLDVLEPMTAKEHFHELIDELTDREADVVLMVLEHHRRPAAPEFDLDDSDPSSPPSAAGWSGGSGNLR
jgi:hypothetical protein